MREPYILVTVNNLNTAFSVGGILLLGFGFGWDSPIMIVMWLLGPVIFLIGLYLFISDIISAFGSNAGTYSITKQEEKRYDNIKLENIVVGPVIYNESPFPNIKYEGSTYDIKALKNLSRTGIVISFTFHDIEKTIQCHDEGEAKALYDLLK